MISFKNNILNRKNSSIGSTIAGILIGLCFLGIFVPGATNADFTNITDMAKVAGGMPKIVKEIKVVVTAYSSTPGQTDNTPFITASGEFVKDGIVANNMLSFGTKIEIPELYGDKIFTVEDRMNKDKKNYHIDIWMPSKLSAVNFGVKTVEIEILEN